MTQEGETMRTIARRITRETPVMDRGRALVVTLHPRYLEIRRKGTRETYTIPYDVCLSMAAKYNLREGATA
jgi:hypothetical protein